MASGVYGIVRGADISPSDCEIFLHYTPSRGDFGDVTLTKLSPSDILIGVQNPNKPNTTSVSEIFGGLYTLKLPSSQFSNPGIYTIIIKPIEIRTTIKECGILNTYPDIKGLVIDLSTVPTQFTTNFNNGNLTGYRIEYITTDSSATERKVRNMFTIITSNNKAEALVANQSNSVGKGTQYRFNDNSSLSFLTVTPSSSPNVKPNAIPYIGIAGQEIILTNTFFNPLMIEIEMVEHDVETLAYALLGPQIISLEDGIYTVYNFNNEIYKQWNLYEIKDQFTGNPLFEVKELKPNVDFTKQFKTVTNI
jgi:hypothetical protein